MDEGEAMERALALAWQGWGRVHPNPMVGAVVLREGRPVGEGWHAEFGGRHAEVMALEAAGAAARGATLVVTLEPCRHEGKQPACTRAIASAGVWRVVYGAGDPTIEAGGGAGELRAAGVEVVLRPTPAVERQNAAFFHAARVPTRPWVALKLATSVDARIADGTGRSRWLSGPEARQWVQWLRAGFDAVAVGGETARTDNPSLTVRGTVIPRVPPRRIVFDRSGNLTGAAQLLASARETPVTVVCETAPTPEHARHLANAGVDTITSRDLADGLRTLRNRGITTLLVEGGGRLAGRLLSLDLVDRFYWLQSPLWLGEDGRPAFAGLRGRGLDQAPRWDVVERKALGSDTLLVLDRPASPEQHRFSAASGG
jgi:diaminohydroxyphosphoribosylaminopyrimidine deaminase/5-amino-6-(5-phosphoribosylamino)uracil reductase